MQYGICNLSIVPVRFEPTDSSEMVSQLLYGEHFKVLEKRAKWSKIRIAFDKYEGWIDNKQYLEVEEEIYTDIHHSTPKFSSDIIEFIEQENKQLLHVPLGSVVSSAKYLNANFDGEFMQGAHPKENLISTAYRFLNAPYLWGGKTPFGLDCSGFTQMVYKLNGYKLLRDASQQAKQGEPLSFIEESEPGDLAFFDNNEGNIIHVGIIMQDNYIIHSHGKVRIDRIDHSGIFNIDSRKHTHKLRVIKKII
ncbi:SH3 domain-containing protein [Pustulibacterium marinum]|uniref:SH3 domain-containing protein n=1 Tax=Pustulibacterium marinum TaxID=1224947 RepID=A0A1I7IZA6_9FLAO|nr:C40 family peptidase [Pustulibacterium marinum]SFU78273.1 SH3 domain-containing protein [Pustulibacterium marinum]